MQMYIQVYMYKYIGYLYCIIVLSGTLTRLPLAADINTSINIKSSV